MAHEDIVSSHERSAKTTVAATTRFWTATRAGQVKPVPMPSITREQREAMTRELRETLSGIDATSGVVVAPQLAPGSAVRAPASSSVRDTRRPQNLSVYPYSTALKMRMAFGGGGYVGSAFIIGRRAVLTAGHCVWDRKTRDDDPDSGGFATNIQFMPLYNNGSQPHGIFTAVDRAVLSEYTTLPDGNNLVYDFGACVVDKDFPAELGVAGYAINHILPKGKLRSVGYPADDSPDFPFDGEEMWTSLGDYWDEGDVPGFGTTADRNYGHYNDMTGGCSGGPIFNADTPPVVVGLNSHVILQSQGGPREQPPRMYSPYFGEPLKRLIKWLKDSGGFPNEITPPPIVPTPNGDDLKADLLKAVDKLRELVGRL